MVADFDLSGKVAIVTGASRGLGQYFARALARAGAHVVITSRSLDSLKQTHSELEAMGRQVLPCTLDVRRLETVQPMLDKVMARFGKIDILVNNAGCNVRKPAVEITADDWAFVVDTILRGSFFVATAVVRTAMLPQKKGRIINVGSGTSVFGMPGIAPYCASRGGITQMTKALAAEWAPHGISVNIIAPGWFRTAQNDILFQNPEWVAFVNSRIPTGRTGLPNDMDGAVIFLASDASAYVTGQLLFVDGGFAIGAMSAMPSKR